MNSPAPLTKMDMIERSLACFWLGLFSLLPLVGALLAVVVLGRIWRLEREQRTVWNPGEEWLKRGSQCALLGLTLALFEILLIFGVMLHHT